MRTAKAILLLMILLSLMTPFFLQRFHLFSEAPLKGYFSESPLPGLKYFTWDRWFRSIFQDDISTRVNDNIGAHKSLIRFSNQLDYSLFGITHAKGFMAGKKGYLFEEDYIHEYNGDYFIGKAPIEKKLERLKDVMDSLRAYHVPLLLVFEPGKASFFPEYIPSRFHPWKKTDKNLDWFLKISFGKGIPFLDLNTWFLKIKDTARYPLFPKYGMHWSLYGAAVAVDTLKRYVEAATGTKLPGFRISRMVPCSIPQGTDNDIGDLLNLVCPLPRTYGAYPEIVFGGSPRRSLSVLVIADSYYVSIAEAYGRKLFRYQDYWYYNKKVYPHQNQDPPPYVDKSNLRDKLKKYDVVLLMVSEINLHGGFWNFADEAYLSFHPEVKDPLVYGLENRIRNEREWFTSISGRSLSEGVPLDRMIRENAEYFFYLYYNDFPGKGYWDTVQYITMNIRNNPEWYNKIMRNAREQHMPVDTALKLNAVYTYEQFKKNR